MAGPISEICFHSVTTSYPGDGRAREGHGDGSWDDLLCSLVCNLGTVDVF